MACTASPRETSNGHLIEVVCVAVVVVYDQRRLPVRRRDHVRRHLTRFSPVLPSGARALCKVVRTHAAWGARPRVHTHAADLRPHSAPHPRLLPPCTPPSPYLRCPHAPAPQPLDVLHVLWNPRSHVIACKGRPHLNSGVRRWNEVPELKRYSGMSVHSTSSPREGRGFPHISFFMNSRATARKMPRSLPTRRVTPLGWGSGHQRPAAGVRVRMIRGLLDRVGAFCGKRPASAS